MSAGIILSASELIAVLHVSFDSESHSYIEIGTGHAIPNVTRMLKECGYIDDRWMTDDGRSFGSYVHDVTKRLDLGSLRPDEDFGKAGPLIGRYAAIWKLVPAKWEYVEVPMASERYRFAGTPDRCGLVYDTQAVLQVKAGQPNERYESVQTALEALLYEERCGIPARFQKRYVAHLRKKHPLSECLHARDFGMAMEVIRTCCSY